MISSSRYRRYATGRVVSIAQLSASVVFPFLLSTTYRTEAKRLLGLKP